MPEPNQIVFTHRELADILVKNQNIHEGLWGIYIEFGIAAGNVADANGTVQPTAIVPVVKIGIQRFNQPNNLTVDAAEVNPTNPENPQPVRHASPLSLEQKK